MGRNRVLWTQFASPETESKGLGFIYSTYRSSTHSKINREFQKYTIFLSFPLALGLSLTLWLHSVSLIPSHQPTLIPSRTQSLSHSLNPSPSPSPSLRLGLAQCFSLSKTSILAIEITQRRRSACKLKLLKTPKQVRIRNDNSLHFYLFVFVSVSR